MLDLCERGEFAFLLTSRQMGKSSLVAKTKAALEANHIAVAAIDLTEIGTQGVTADQWYLGILSELEEVCKTEPQLFDWWGRHEHLSHAQRFVFFLAHSLLPRLQSQLVVFIDEIDTTIKLPFADDFFAALRATHNARAANPQFEKISFVLLGVASPSELIKDPTRTPFNIGIKIELTDFDSDEISRLIHSLDGSAQEKQVLQEELQGWTGGQPYLCQRVCAELDARPLPEIGAIGQRVGEILLSDAGPSDPHFQFISQYLLAAPADEQEEMLNVYERVLHNKPVSYRDISPVHNRLRLSGIVRREDDQLVMRNRVYRRLFGQDWIRKNRKKSWLAANRRWLTALGLSLSAATVLGVTALIAVRAEHRAELSASIAQQNERSAQAGELAIKAQSELMQGEIGLGLLLANHALQADRHNRVVRATAIHAADLAEASNPVGGGELKAHIVQLSPDGRLVAYAGNKPGVHLWDTNSGEQTNLSGLPGTVSKLAFSPDGRYLFAGDLRGQARLWDLRQPAEAARILPTQHARIDAALFSPDGQSLSLANAQGHVQVLASATGRMIYQLKSQAGPQLRLATSRDGATLCLGAADGTLLVLSGTGYTQERSIKLAPRPINILLMTPDGSQIIAAAWNGGASLWNARSGARSAWLNAQNETVRSAALAPDGKTVALADELGMIRIWSLATHKLSSAFAAHGGAVHALGYSADGRRLVSAGEDGLSKVWSLPAGQLVAQSARGQAVEYAALTADGRKALALDAYGAASLWSIDRGMLMAELPANGASITDARFSDDGRTIALQAAQEVQLRDDFLRPIGDGSLTLPAGVKARVFLSSSGQLLYLDEQGGLHRWDGRQLRSITLASTTGQQSIVGGSFNRDGSRVLTIHADGRGVAHDGLSGQTLFTLKQATPITTAIFSEDGKELLSSDAKNKLRLWSGMDGRLIRDFEPPPGLAVPPVDAGARTRLLHFSAGARLVLVDAARRVLSLDTRSGEYTPLATLAPGSVNDTLMHGDGMRFIARESEREVWVYDALASKALASLAVGSKGGSISSAGLDANGENAISGNDEGRVDIWDVASNARLIELRGHAGRLKLVRLSPDGRRALTLDQEGLLRTWDVSRARRSSDEISALLNKQAASLKRELSAAECIVYFSRSSAIRPGECNKPRSD
nr:AAA-like domain-containing protein [Roseateles oligotrophus]